VPLHQRSKHQACRIIDPIVDLDHRLRAALDRALADVRAAAQAELDEVRRSAEQTTSALRATAARLSDCIQAIDAAPSLGAVLTVLAGCARLEAGRASIVLVSHGLLSSYPSRTGVAPDQARVVTRALQHGTAVVEPDAAAFPIAVGGQVVAVLFVAAPSSTEVQQTLDLLTRHASRVLEAMTVCRISGLLPHPNADVAGGSST
jgi:hypothetical protein